MRHFFYKRSCKAEHVISDNLCALRAEYREFRTRPFLRTISAMNRWMFARRSWQGVKASNYAKAIVDERAHEVVCSSTSADGLHHVRLDRACVDGSWSYTWGSIARGGRDPHADAGGGQRDSPFTTTIRGAVIIRTRRFSSPRTSPRRISASSSLFRSTAISMPTRCTSRASRSPVGVRSTWSSLRASTTASMPSTRTAS